MGPSHAYKFAATLQAAQACDRPILLRVARDASHRYESATEAIAERADMRAILSSRVGIVLGGRKTATGAPARPGPQSP